MIPRPFDDISMADLQALIDNEVSESRTLEYKEQLPEGGDEPRKEFLADVSAFANTDGGDIIFGIAERRENNKTTGIPQNIVGFPSATVDAEKLRIENMLRDGIDPRIAGIQVKPVEVSAGLSALLLRIPRSWAAPHMVTYKSTSRFYARNSAGKYQLDVREIRAAYDLSASVPERIQRFRRDRLALIAANEGPVEFPANPAWAKMLLHVFPVSALSAGSVIDAATLRPSGSLVGLPRLSPGDGTSTGRFNLDGFLIYEITAQPPEQETRSYTQLFRTGIVEAVEVRRDDLGRFLSQEFDARFNAAVNRYLQWMRQVGIQPPIVVMLSLLNARGYSLWIDESFLPPQAQRLGANQPFDRDVVLLPDVIVESYEEPSSTIIKPILDALYQATGWERCLSYDSEGRWLRP